MITTKSYEVCGHIKITRHKAIKVLYLLHRHCNKPVRRRFLLDVHSGGRRQTLGDTNLWRRVICLLRPGRSFQILTFCLGSSLHRLLCLFTLSSIEKQHTPPLNFKLGLPTIPWFLPFAKNLSDIDKHGPSFRS